MSAEGASAPHAIREVLVHSVGMPSPEEAVAELKKEFYAVLARHPDLGSAPDLEQIVDLDPTMISSECQAVLMPE